MQTMLSFKDLMLIRLKNVLFLNIDNNCDFSLYNLNEEHFRRDGNISQINEKRFLLSKIIFFCSLKCL